jgi:hypothetical protein
MFTRLNRVYSVLNPRAFHKSSLLRQVCLRLTYVTQESWYFTSDFVSLNYMTSSVNSLLRLGVERWSPPITGLDRPLGFQEVEVPRFLDKRRMKAVGCQPYAPARKYSWYSFPLEAESTADYANVTIGNRTRDLPVCSTVPQPTAPPRPHILVLYRIIRRVEAFVFLVSLDLIHLTLVSSVCYLFFHFCSQTYLFLFVRLL